MEIVPEEAQSEGHKFGTQHLRNPLPSGHHQPNKLQQIQSYTRRNTTHKSTPSQRSRGPRLRELSPGFEILKFRVVYSPFYLQVIKYTWSAGGCPP